MLARIRLRGLTTKSERYSVFGMQEQTDLVES